MWLNEGFATFFQYYAVEDLYHKSFVWQWWYLFTREDGAMFHDKDIPSDQIHSWKKWQPSILVQFLKNGLILPRGQWYATSAVINDAWYHMELHGNAWYCMVLHGIAW